MLEYWLLANAGVILYEYVHLVIAALTDESLARTWMVVMSGHMLVFTFCELLRLKYEEIKDKENEQ